MTESIKLPVGIESFEEIRSDGYYYVDKTKLIEQLVDSRGKVNLFTRPRRFGKTLNMSMLKSFFEIGAASELFDGLYISHNKKLCDDNMGKYPVIFLSLKNVEGLDFQAAKYQMIEIIAKEAKRFVYLKHSDRLDIDDKSTYASLIRLEDGRYEMRDEALYASLQTLSELLYKHHGRKTVILIDEYDVPLDKAFQNGYYKEMVSLIRAIFGKALKTNEALDFAVLTGCLRVSKESIFTGLNNFKILSITDTRFDEHFGFTDEEVERLLAFYHVENRFAETKEWYDGYHFGNVDVYCPWDVINHVDRIKDDPMAGPEAYWINTSGNDLVKRFIDKANKTARNEIETLVTGGSVEKNLNIELTYEDIDRSIENLWSVLFTTGYLTQRGRAAGDTFQLVIPNMEIRKIFTDQIMDFFKENVPKNGVLLNTFCEALRNGETETIEKCLCDYLRRAISIRDTFVRKKMKENFYHGILLGILGYEESWSVSSNKESGDGYSDIVIETDDGEMGIILELKYAQDGDLETACQSALEQIGGNNYIDILEEDGVEKILKYGIAFYKKRCRVMIGEKS